MRTNRVYKSMPILRAEKAPCDSFRPRKLEFFASCRRTDEELLEYYYEETFLGLSCAGSWKNLAATLLEIPVLTAYDKERM